MTHHERPPAAAADDLVGDMLAFLRGGPLPDPSGGVAEAPGGTKTWSPGAATAEPLDFTLRPDDTEADRVIGPYRVIARVGRGGMGVVYHARHRDIPREAAIKTIRAELDGRDDVRDRFRVEAAAVASLDHPNVIKLFDFDEYAGELYLAMEWAPGGNLAARLAGRPMPPRAAAELVRALAGAMAYAHDRGVLHRDLKPNNVLLAANGTPKIADFGLARLLATEDTRLTISGAVMGTPGYMSPEQAAGRDRDVGVRSDVYALGAILYEALTGQPPFSGGTKEELLRRVQDTEPPRPSSLAPGLPAELEAVCLCCMEKNAARRYATAADLAADLRRYLAGEPTVVRPHTPLRRAVRAARRRWRPLAATAGVAALCVATVMGVAAYLQPSQPDGESTVVRASMEADLRAGRPVELVGPTGWPKWFRWASGVPAGQRLALDTGRVLTAESHDDRAASLLELLPDPTTSRYRVTAQLRNDWSKPTAAVGLYVAHRAYPHQPRDLQTAVVLRFNGASGPPGTTVHAAPGGTGPPTVLVPENTNSVELAVQSTATRAGLSPYTARVAGAGAKRIAVVGAHSGRWYDVSITVTPDGVTAVLGGDTLTLDAAAIDQAAADALAELTARDPADHALGDLRPAFAPGGGVGVFAYRASVSVRNLTVTPAPDSNRSP